MMKKTRLGLALCLLLVSVQTSVVLTSAQNEYTYTRRTNPDRTIVADLAGRWLATFTDQSYTVTLAGPERTFSDPNAKHEIVSQVWVRVLPAPFAGEVDEGWLTRALHDSSPDIFAIAMQYLGGAPAVTDAQGLQIAGAAEYGPVEADDTREEGGDFNDYLGIPWTFDGHERHPKPDFFRSLDCSGYMRMVWGYRGGLPLTYTRDDGNSIPRHSWEILASAPGVVIIPDTEAQVTDFSRLMPGDLGFSMPKRKITSRRSIMWACIWEKTPAGIIGLFPVDRQLTAQPLATLPEVRCSTEADSMPGVFEQHGVCRAATAFSFYENKGGA